MNGSKATQQWALVLAGGDGTRLRELTQVIAGAPIPKQYCRIFGDHSLLEATLQRTAHFTKPERTLVVVNRDHLDLAREQLRQLPAHCILVQPRNCDTGPGLLFSLLHLAQRRPDAIVAVFPSDHYVGDDRAFVNHVQRGTRVVAQYPEKVVLLGIRPDRSEPGYGYIEPARPLAAAELGAAFHVAAFREKPSARLAQTLVSRGGLWNSFVMVFHLQRVLDLLRARIPDHFEQLSTVAADPEGISRRYRELAPWNFSSDFLARIPEHLIVLRVDDVQWNDWGTPQAIERTLRALKKEPPWRARWAPAAA